MTTDGRYGESLAAVHENDSWQRHPSQTWRCKRCDGSNLQRHRKRKRGRRREIWGSGRGDCGSKYHAFRLQTPVLINTVPHTRAPPPPFASQPDLSLEHWHRGLAKAYVKLHFHSVVEVLLLVQGTYLYFILLIKHMRLSRWSSQSRTSSYCISWCFNSSQTDTETAIWFLTVLWCGSFFKSCNEMEVF